MRLISLEVIDFRGFYGARKLDFAADDVKRVTIFYGENGAGKTNLLNAIHWCVTGLFTPRFQDRQMLVNKEAYKEGRRECTVELVFRQELESGGETYRVRRTATNERQLSFDVFRVKRGNSELVQRGDSLIRMLFPPGLISWFFFDAEAIGSLELSGSPEFKRDLRKTLGFELVDTLVSDLEKVQSKRQREIATQTRDTALQELQTQIEGIERVLPGQKERLVEMDRQFKDLTKEWNSVRAKLEKQPQTEQLERSRKKLELLIPKLEADKKLLSARAAKLIGSSAAPLILLELTRRLDGKLDDQEVKGKLPSPYSDQLVKDILERKVCICGRPVVEGSEEAHKVHDLMKFASTGALNQRINGVRLLIRDIERQSQEFPIQAQEVRTRIADIDSELGLAQADLKDIKREIDAIDVDAIRALEKRSDDLDTDRMRVQSQRGALEAQVTSNEKRHVDYTLQYTNLQKRLVINARLKKEWDKTTRLIEYIKRSSEDQEQQALIILSHELNSVLVKYLTKHYQAKVDPKTYAVQLLDNEGKKVGHSTGEGQVLKFAFIATVVAMAAKKTQQKIQWLSEPTIAPLVLDAPFSALDPEYQGSVAKNLAAQTTQLVLMISSAAWGDKVADALRSSVGKRYLIVSNEFGPQSGKPIKKLTLNGTEHILNRYGAQRTESVFEEIR